LNTITKEKLLALAERLMKDRIMIPPQKVGRYKVTREAVKPGSKLLVASFRDALLSGMPPCDLPIEAETYLHKLNGPTGTWMSDLPCELVQMWLQLAKYARGHVLIGGLGLGVLARMVASKKTVRSATIIERQPEVIEMIEDYLGGGTVRVIQADILPFSKAAGAGKQLAPNKKSYDVVLLDTWAGTGESEWLESVVPLRRALCRNRLYEPKNIHCWQEEVMITQVAGMLYRVAADVDPSLFGSKYQCHYGAFREGLEQIGMREAGEYRIDIKERGTAKVHEIEQENLKDEALRGAVACFLRLVGDPIWESIYGKAWDRRWNQRKEKTA